MWFKFQNFTSKYNVCVKLNNFYLKIWVSPQNRIFIWRCDFQLKIMFSLLKHYNISPQNLILRFLPQFLIFTSLYNFHHKLMILTLKWYFELWIWFSPQKHVSPKNKNFIWLFISKYVFAKNYFFQFRILSLNCKKWFKI